MLRLESCSLGGRCKRQVGDMHQMASRYHGARAGPEIRLLGCRRWTEASAHVFKKKKKKKELGLQPASWKEELREIQIDHLLGPRG